ncbi:MAG: cupin domain-containing protein [Janthinobacterium lividum]
MPNSNPSFRPADTLHWESTSPGVRRAIVAHNADMMLVRVEFRIGAVGALHQHASTQISYIESGEFAVTIGEETRIMYAGDSFYVAPNVPHSAYARQAGVLLDSFSPARQDFLPPTY